MENVVVPEVSNESNQSQVEATYQMMQVRVHPGEKPFACDFCDYTAREHRTLTSHIMRIHKEVESSKNPLQIEPNADWGESTDFCCLTELNVVQCASLIHPPQLKITEVHSLNDGVSPKGSPAPEENPRDYAALPGPSKDPLLLKMEEDKNESPIESIRIEASLCDQLNFYEKEKSLSKPQQIKLNQFPNGPPSDGLQLKISNEHSEDCDSPSGLERAAAGLSNVVNKSSITEELKPSFDSSSYPLVEPNDLKLVICQKMSQDDLQSETLLVGVTEMETQDSGPSTNSKPEIFCADDNIIRCGICDFKTRKKYRYKLRDHMNVHTGDRPFLCVVCGSRFRYKVNLFKHRKMHSSQVDLKGIQDEPQDDPRTLTPTKYKLVDNTNVHTGDGPFLCVLCGSRFPYKVNLFKHSWEIHSRKIPFTHTPNCGSSINSELIDPSQVELEEIQDEPQDDPLQCDVPQDCGPTMNPKPLICGDDNTVRCSVCDFKTQKKYKYKLRDHMNIHTGYRPHACDFCNYTAKRRDNLRAHVRSVHTEKYTSTLKCNLTSQVICHVGGRKMFACDFCDRNYLAEYNLKRHIIVIHNREPSPHFDSTKSNSDSTSKQSHVNSAHVGDETSSDQSSVVELLSGGEDVERKINTCEFCGHPFTTSADMNQHIANYHESGSLGLSEEFSKAFTCNGSNRKTREGDLASQSVNHGGVEQLTCTHPDCEADEESMLSDHIMSVPPDEDEYACYSCDYKASNVKDVEQHILSTHNPSTVETPSFAERSADMTPTKVETSIPPQGEVNEYSCYACDYESREVWRVEDHILSAHPVTNAHAAPPDLPSESQGCDASPPSVVHLEEYFCYTCDYKAGNVEQVQQHILSTHKPPISQTTTTLVDLTTEYSDTEQ